MGCNILRKRSFFTERSYKRQYITHSIHSDQSLNVELLNNFIFIPSDHILKG